MFDEKDWSPKFGLQGQVHIVPNNDLREHTLSWTCECTPAFVPSSPGWDEWHWVLEHNAFDLREEFEKLDH